MAKSRELRVTVTGDPSSLQRALRKVDHSAKTTEDAVSGFGKRSAVALHKLGVAAGVALGAAVVEELHEAAKAAINAEAAQAKLRVSLRNSNISYRRYGEEIERALERQAELTGFTKEDLSDALANMVRTTGSVNKALKLNAIATDVARTKGLQLGQAQSLLARTYNGSFVGLKRLGITVQPVTKNLDALRASTKTATIEQVRHAKALDALATRHQALSKVQHAFAGQAKAYGETTAGAYARARASIEIINEKVGAVFLPILAQAGEALVKFVRQMQDGVGSGGKFAHVMQEVGRYVKIAAHDISVTVKWLQRHKEVTSVATTAVAGLAAALAAYTGAVKIAAAATLLLGANPIVLAAAAVVGLGVALVVAYKRSEKFRAVVQAAFTSVWKTATFGINIVLTQIKIFLRGLAEVFGAASHLPGVGKRFKSIADGVNHAADRVDGLRRSIVNLPDHKRVKVGVDIDLNTAKYKKLYGGGFNYAGGGVPSHGDGVGRAVSGIARAAGQRMANQYVSEHPPAAPVVGGVGSSALMGASSALAPFASVGSRFGLHVTSGLRRGAKTVSGNTSFHALGEAIDESGPPSAMMRFARYMRDHFGPVLAELIYTPMGVGIKDGRPYRYTGAVAAEHYNHVHVAYEPGTGNRHPRGDGPGHAVAAAARNARSKGAHYSQGQLQRLWVQAGGDPRYAFLASAIALAESGGYAGASNRNRDGSIDRGLWEIDSVHGSLSTFDPSANARAAVAISNNGRNWRPWTTYNSGAYKPFYLGKTGLSRTALAKLGPKVTVGKAGAGHVGLAALGRYGRVNTDLTPGIRGGNIYEMAASAADYIDYLTGTLGLDDSDPKVRAALKQAAQLEDISARQRQARARAAARAGHLGRAQQLTAAARADARQGDAYAKRATAVAADTSTSDLQQELLDTQKSLRDEVARLRAAIAPIEGISTAQALRAFTDTISGQLGYRTAGRALTPSYGVAARY